MPAARKIILFLFVFSVLLSCKKENDRPQWDIQVVAPLFHASLGISNFFADSLIVTDTTKAVHLVYEDNLYSNTFSLDSLFKIPDTVITTLLTYPFPSGVLQPNQPVYAANLNAHLNISGAELREVIIKSGFIRIEIHNQLQTRVIYNYIIPGATHNGNVFQFTTTMSPAPPGGYSSYIQQYDMSGYRILLTGSSGHDVNTIAYTVNARTDTGVTPINIFLGDTLVNVQAALQSIVPYYAKGYLGQTEVSEDSSSAQTDFFNVFQSGNIRLEDVTMKFTIENNIGVDGQAFITHIQSVNTSTNTVVDLNSPTVLNHPININRATETGNASQPVNPSYTEIQFDNSNSNLRSLIENFPDHLTYGLRLDVNPLGNISGSNDFVYSDYLVNAKIRVELPLSFAADQLALADTAILDIQNKGDFDAIGTATFTLIADNGFPFEASVKLWMLDEHNQVLDSIPIAAPVAAADVDANFKVIAPKRTLIPVYVDGTRKSNLLNAKSLSIHASFTTPAFPQYYQIYADYKLNLKLVADATYLIR